MYLFPDFFDEALVKKTVSTLFFVFAGLCKAKTYIDSAFSFSQPFSGNATIDMKGNNVYLSAFLIRYFIKAWIYVVQCVVLSFSAGHYETDESYAFVRILTAEVYEV